MARYYSDATAVYPIDNVFGINNPDSYECHIKRYDARLSYLEVYTRPVDQSSLPESFFTFAFNAVEYFEGTMTWIGANFRIAPPQDCIQIARKLPKQHKMSDQDILDFYELYVVETKQLQVKILAGSGGLVTVKE